MKVIIIEEERFAEFLELLNNTSQNKIHDNTPERMGWDKQIWIEAVKEARSGLHYRFVQWAQSHGASCVR